MGDWAREALRSGLALGLASSNSACLATALYSFVAVLVMLIKVLKERLVLLRNLTLGSKLGKHAGESLDSFLVEVVLVRLHIAELGKGLVAVIKFADVRLHALVSLFMRANVATLGKRLSTNATAKRLLSGMTTHVCLEIATLGKGEATVFLVANIRLGTSVSTAVNIQVRLLNEALVAAWTIANPLLLGLAVSKSRSAAGSGGLGVVSARCESRSRSLTSLNSGLGLPSLDCLHELVNIRLKVDSVAGVNRLVVSNRLGIGSRVRRDG